MFKYLYNPTKSLKKADGAFVFGRIDPLVAKKASDIYNQGLVNYVMFTGGIGKDAGFLKKLNIPEAKFQAALSNIFYNVPEDKIYVEPRATHGGECCRFGIDTIVENLLPHKNLILVIHPTSLRRIAATIKVIAPEKEFKSNYQRVGTDYFFNPDNPIDQKEAIEELLKLADWPKKNWCEPQQDLPEHLVKYARDVKENSSINF